MKPHEHFEHNTTVFIVLCDFYAIIMYSTVYSCLPDILFNSLENIHTDRFTGAL